MSVGIQEQATTYSVYTNKSKAPLTGVEKRSLWSLVFAYACLVSNTTLVVGSSAVVVMSVGGANSTAPIALAMFFLGSAFVSLITAPLFNRKGRKYGFMFGIGLGLFGALLAGIGVAAASPALVIIGSIPLGAANGIGMYLRFAAVEVVPPHMQTYAVTLVLSGGCIAAFTGPESSQLTAGAFGDDEQEYLGVYVMVAVFNVLNAIFVGCVTFPLVPIQDDSTPVNHLQRDEQDDDDEEEEMAIRTNPNLTLEDLLKRRQFWVPALIAAFSWGIMAMPMSIVRVALQELDFSTRASLLTIEFHFLGMFSPGFITGKLINRFGAITVSGMSVGLFVFATVLSFISSEASLAPWMLALIIYGVGWNFGFSSATVLLADAYADAPAYKPHLEAANDFVMFMLSGTFIFTTGYIYEGGGGGHDGWITVNSVIFALVGLMALLVMWVISQQLDEEILKTDKRIAAAENGHDGEDHFEDEHV